MSLLLFHNDYFKKTTLVLKIFLEPLTIGVAREVFPQRFFVRPIHLPRLHS
jgi:hypothetical protein